MSGSVTISLQKREVIGKAVRALRREGLVPAVIHDHGKASIVVSGVYIDMARAYRQAGKHHPIEISADGKKYTALIKEVSVNPKRNTLSHIVFNAVSANQKVDAEIPVRIKYAEGNDASPAERAGLIVLHTLEAVEVVAIPSALPDFLEFDGEKLVEVGDVATVADLIIPKGVEVKTDAAHQIASVFEPSALAAANDAAGGDADDDVVEATAEAETEAKTEAGAEASGDKPAEAKDKTEAAS